MDILAFVTILKLLHIKWSLFKITWLIFFITSKLHPKTSVLRFKAPVKWKEQQMKYTVTPLVCSHPQISRSPWDLMDPSQGHTAENSSNSQVPVLSLVQTAMEQWSWRFWSMSTHLKLLLTPVAHLHHGSSLNEHIPSCLQLVCVKVVIWPFLASFPCSKSGRLQTIALLVDQCGVHQPKRRTFTHRLTLYQLPDFPYTMELFTSTCNCR